MCSPFILNAQVVDTLLGEPSDSTALNLKVDSNNTEVVPQKKASSSSLDSKVDYQANDSIVMDLKTNKAYLYGEAVVLYENLELKADFIEIDFKTNIVYAKGREDSTGTLVGKPVFTEAGKEYQAGEMTYNFETKKGKIKEAFSKEGEGYVHGESIKMHAENVIYIRNGKYTTCSNQEHPHFHIQATKLKIITEDKIVTGPAQMYVAEIPTPLVVPFGIFPNKPGRQSGIIIPTYGNSPGLGFFLMNGGYYFGKSDVRDLSLTGDIYSNGSYGLHAVHNYNKRYRSNGAVNLDFSEIRRGDPEAADFSKNSTFFVRWRHTQDPKATPKSNFSASVDAGSVNNFQNDFSTIPRDYLSNQFKSNISYSRTLGKNFRGTLNANHSQNSIDSSIAVTLPQATLTMNRIFPFKRKVAVGKDAWYERIGLSLTSDFRNQVRTKQDSIFLPQTLNKMQNGMQHTIPISTNIKIGYVTINPNMNFTERWYFQTIRNRWDNDSRNVFQDTVSGFERFGQASFNTGISTKIYGMYSMKKGRIKAVRHTITPNMGINYTPDWTSSRWFNEYQTDTLGNSRRYSIFDRGIYGGPSQRQSAVITFNVQNSLEMKYLSRSDTAQTLKKGKLLDAFNFSTSYDIFRDSLNWDPIRVDARTNIGENLNFRVDAILDPYAQDSLGRSYNKTHFSETGQLLRLNQVQGTVGFRLQGKKKDEKKPDVPNPNDPMRQDPTADAFRQDIQRNPGAYVDFNIPWNLNINYNITYSRRGNTNRLINTLNFQGDINITEGWKIGVQSGYDFELQSLSFTNINIMRDLHCWQIMFNAVPFGPRTSYMLDVHVKASVLQDLKITRRRSWFDQR